jgi:hypothetical protein
MPSVYRCEFMDKTVDKSVCCRILKIENFNFTRLFFGDGYNDEKNVDCHCDLV